MRAVIADHSTPLHTLFADKQFKARFKNGFSRFNISKRVPRGYDADHPEAERLKLKSFLVVKKIPFLILCPQHLLMQSLKTTNNHFD